MAVLLITVVRLSSTTIRESAHVAVQATGDGFVTVQSGPQRMQCRWTDIHSWEQAASYCSGEYDWAGYIIGCAVWLYTQGHAIDMGLKIKVDSHVPIGKGVSSSAALELRQCVLLRR